jgi:hypothetical protein
MKNMFLHKVNLGKNIPKTHSGGFFHAYIA